MPGFYDSLGLIDVKLHSVQLAQQVVGKLNVGLVDFIDQQDRLLVGLERLPDLAAYNVIGDIVNTIVTKL